MPAYVTPILVVVGLLVAPLLLIAFGLVTSVNAMSNPNLRLREASESEHHDLFAAAASHHAWAKEQGFEWHGAYTIAAPQEILIAAWLHRDSARCFCIYSHGPNDYYDLVTMFEDGKSLTTAGTKDAHTLPTPPGKWVQSEHDAEHEDLWELHLAGERFLGTEHGLRPGPPGFDFPKAVTKAIREQMKYVTSHPLWQVRGVWWYLSRGKRSGITVEQQERGR